MEMIPTRTAPLTKCSPQKANRMDKCGPCLSSFGYGYSDKNPAMNLYLSLWQGRVVVHDLSTYSFSRALGVNHCSGGNLWSSVCFLIPVPGRQPPGHQKLICEACIHRRNAILSRCVIQRRKLASIDMAYTCSSMSHYMDIVPIDISSQM